jgi:peptidoglycan/LPS O-acetylase OafA/YrhL
MTYIAVRSGPISVGPAAPRLVLTLSFLFGVCIHMFRARIPLNIYLFAASALLSYVFLAHGDLAFLAPAPVAYMTVFLGCAKLPKLKLWDLSYGIYLFHYAILASVFHVLGPEAHWWDLLAFGLPLTLLFALGSWTLVERPVLTRKAAILAFIDRYLAWRPANAAIPAAVLPTNGGRDL